MDEFLGTMLLGVLVFVGMTVGHVWTDYAWRRDCVQLGKTVSSGAVFECKKIEKAQK